jgi:hypothetical protein
MTADGWFHSLCSNGDSAPLLDKSTEQVERFVTQTALHSTPKNDFQKDKVKSSRDKRDFPLVLYGPLPIFFVITWLILPAIICLSQRLSHACLSISNYTTKLRKAHYISYNLLDWFFSWITVGILELIHAKNPYYGNVRRMRLLDEKLIWIYPTKMIHSNLVNRRLRLSMMQTSICPINFQP